jgi:hypothetical protein
VDSRFIATPSQTEVQAALQCWPELAGGWIRPALITAFGDIFVETHDGPVLVVDTLELVVEQVALSLKEFTALFDDPAWANERLLIELVLLADERGVTRGADQVFAVCPHPSLGAPIVVEHLMPMSLPAWHQLCASIAAR